MTHRNDGPNFFLSYAYKRTLIINFSAVAYIYRDERRKVMPPMVAASTAEGVLREIPARHAPGFGLKWSLNEQEPTVRSHADFGLKNYDKGYTEKDFYSQ